MQSHIEETTVTWRARSAADYDDKWPFWYLTRDTPQDYNETPVAYSLVTGKKFPPRLPLLPKEWALEMADALNSSAEKPTEKNP